MSSRGFFIGNFGSNDTQSSCDKGNIVIQDGSVMMTKPLEFYVDDVSDVYAGGNSDSNNAMLIYWTENEIYVRKVEY